jgi:hypothetical protein
MRAADGMTRLEIRRAGPFELRAAETAGTVLDMVVDGDPRRTSGCDVD